MFVKNSIIALGALAAVASAHSWAQNVNGGVERGGVIQGDDAHNTHYFCPTENLADCQPAANTKMTLTAVNQRPCDGIAEPSNPMGQATAGGPLTVQWPGNGHSLVTGTCVSLYIAPFAADPSMADFTQLAACLPYGPSEATVTLPAHLANGQYTIFWLWDFATFWFSSCVDIVVTGGAEAAAGAPSPVTTAAPSVTTTPVPLQANDAQPVGKHPDYFAYKRFGCDKVAADFCTVEFGSTSYCREGKRDPCNRRLCQSDSQKNLEPCNPVSLLLL